MPGPLPFGEGVQLALQPPLLALRVAQQTAALRFVLVALRLQRGEVELVQRLVLGLDGLCLGGLVHHLVEHLLARGRERLELGGGVAVSVLFLCQGCADFLVL